MDQIRTKNKSRTLGTSFRLLTWVVTLTLSYSGAFAAGKGPSFHVTDGAGRAIARAKILIGSKLGDPFKDNWLITDDSGSIELATPWSQSLPVTIDAPGYTRLTVMDQKAEEKTFQLKLMPMMKDLVVEGDTGNFGSFPNDGYAHFGIVLPLLDPATLLTFNPLDLLSSQVDILSVYGKKIALPSNFTLPRQDQQYGFFPITLDKPNYSWLVDHEDSYTLAAVHGKFPFRKVIDAIQSGKQISEVFNDCDFLSAGVRTINVQGARQSLDLSVNDVAINTPVQVQAPNLPSGETLAVTSLSSYNGKYYPTDLKQLKSRESRSVKLRANDNAPIIFAVRTKIGTRAQFQETSTGEIGMNLYKLSAASGVLYFDPFHQKLAPEPLELLAPPSYDRKNNLHVNIPKSAPAMIEKMTVATLLEVIPYHNQLGDFEKLKAKWEVTTSDWTRDISLPEWPEDTLGKANRWEVALMGAGASANKTLGTTRMTHVTRNSVNF